MLIIKLGIIFALLSVVIGAFGAHSLENIIANKMDVFKTAVQYQMFHSMALIFTGLIAIITKIDLVMVGYLFSAGILLFSGSLYIVSIFKLSKIGIITPFGGLFFIIAWGFLFYRISSL